MSHDRPTDPTGPSRPVRTPDAGVPPTKARRDRLRRQVRQYVADRKLVPPLMLPELREHCHRFAEQHDIEPAWSDWLAVLMHNAAWRSSVSAVPYNKRLLLLPQCLRDPLQCPARFDDVGLLCRSCGRCEIGRLLDEADRLGYVTLVAEGSPVVSAMIASGQVQAVVGVSCLDSLERVHPYMEAAAVPGVAIPLLYEGCENTVLDMDWLWEALQMHSDEGLRPIDFDAVRAETLRWFTPDALEEILGPASGDADRVGREWLARAGKRWRPALAVATFRALGGATDADDLLRRVAIAVECFHKASLVHDDIEDGDDTRYGQATLHAQHGLGVALNVGDLLLGEGYRLLAEAKVPGERRVDMLAVASQAHRQLCLGQGDELAWVRDGGDLNLADVLEIHRRKTAPAFEVALKLGALAAGGCACVDGPLSQYSRALGIGYQILDDMRDVLEPQDPSDIQAGRPNAVIALARQHADADQRARLDELLAAGDESSSREARHLLTRLGAARRACRLLESFRTEAIASLTGLDCAPLKALLRRVAGRIFRETESMGCCEDGWTADASGGASGADSAA